MKKIGVHNLVRGFSCFLVLLLLGCTRQVDQSTDLCFSLVEGDTETILRLVLNPESQDMYPHQLEIGEIKNGKKVPEDLLVPGRIKDGRILIFPDGSAYEFGEEFKMADPSEGAQFPEIKASKIQTPLDGLVFKKRSCP